MRCNIMKLNNEVKNFMDGYKIIDFKGANLAEGYVPGIYNAVNESNKPLVFSNYAMGDHDTIGKPFFAGIGIYETYSPGKYQYTFHIMTNSSGEVNLLNVKDDDTIEIETV